MTANTDTDRLLARLESDVALCLQNMVELAAHRTYVLLCAMLVADPAKSTRLAGLTLARANHVIPPFQELFGHVDLLKSQVSRARQIRDNLPIIGREAKMQEVLDLLTHIKLPSQAVPLEKRGLLTAAEISQEVTAERLLAAMSASFDETNKLVHEVKQVWSKSQTRLDELDRELKEVQADADEVAQTSSPDIAVALSALGDARSLILSDPLAAGDQLDQQVMPAVDACKARLASLKALKQQVCDDLAGARLLMAQVKEARERAVIAMAERRDKIAIDREDQLTMPDDASVLDQLETWLTRLEQTANEKRYLAASVGLPNWMTHARNRLSAANSACVANETLVQERRDLRGQLAALKAYAAAEGMAEDAALTAIYREAETLLFQRPTAIVKARDLVSKYRQALLK